MMMLQCFEQRFVHFDALSKDDHAAFAFRGAGHSQGVCNQRQGKFDAKKYMFIFNPSTFIQPKFARSSNQLEMDYAHCTVCTLKNRCYITTFHICLDICKEISKFIKWMSNFVDEGKKYNLKGKLF